MSDPASRTASPFTTLYQICVREEIDDRWLGWFDEYTLTRTERGESLLTGWFVDQASLHGLLARIRDLNLTLISVHPIEAKKDPL